MSLESELLNRIESIPDFIPKFNEEEVRAGIREKLNSILFKPENSDLAKKFEEALVYCLNLIYVNEAIFYANQFIDYAKGLQLDKLATLYGIERKQEIPPMGKVKIKSAADTPLLFIADTTQFITDKGEVGLLMGNVNATPEGVEAYLQTLKEGDLKFERPMVPIFGFGSMESLSTFTKVSEYENDDKLRQRMKDSLSRFSTAGAKATYEYYASSIPGVKEVTAYNNGAGKVLLVFDGEEKYKDVINKRLIERRPITDSVEVRKATDVELNITLTITFNKEAEEDSIIDSISKTLEREIKSLKIGESIPHSKFYSFVTHHESIYRTIVDAETLDKIQSVGVYEILKLKTLTINKEYRGK